VSALSDDAALRALDDLRVQLDSTIADLHAARERLDQLAEWRRTGRTWAEIVAHEERPLVVETIARVLGDLGETGSRLRQEEALALQREHLSITRIGQLFGVSRQRISAILRDQAASAGSAPELQQRDREAQVAQDREA
jgi:hypothetical protein